MKQTQVIKKAYLGPGNGVIFETEDWPTGPQYEDDGQWDMDYYRTIPGRPEPHNDIGFAFQNTLVSDEEFTPRFRFIRVQDPNAHDKGIYEPHLPEETTPGEQIWNGYKDSLLHSFAWSNAALFFWDTVNDADACTAMHNLLYSRYGADMGYVFQPPFCDDMIDHCSIRIGFRSFAGSFELEEDGIFTLSLSYELDEEPAEIHLFTKEDTLEGYLNLTLDQCYTEDMYVIINKGQELRSGIYSMRACRDPW